jgi:AcrR family transcriptional regulator
MIEAEIIIAGSSRVLFIFRHLTFNCFFCILTYRPVSKQEKSALDKRDQIIYAAIRLYSQRGIHNVSMNEIAARVGITKPAVYYYFRSKEALIEAVVEMYYFGYLQKQINLQDRSDLQPIDRLKGAFQLSADDFSAWNRRLSEDEMERYSFDMITVEAIAQYPQIAEKLKALSERWAQAVVKTVSEGKKRGEISSEVSTENAALSMIAMVEGSYFLCYDMEDLDPEKFLSDMAEMYLRSVRP